MPSVRLAYDITDDRDVAITMLHADMGAALGAARFLCQDSCRISAGVMALPIKARGGSRGPVRVVALIPRR